MESYSTQTSVQLSWTHSYQPLTLYPIFFWQNEVCAQAKLLGIINANSDVADQLMIISSTYVTYYRKFVEYETVHQLFIQFKKAYDSLYNILTDFCIYTKPVWLIKTYKLNLYISIHKASNMEIFYHYYYSLSLNYTISKN